MFERVPLINELAFFHEENPKRFKNRSFEIHLDHWSTSFSLPSPVFANLLCQVHLFDTLFIAFFMILSPDFLNQR